ncbi:MAG: hypothetical protein HYW79_03340 [Parcubacteria group bacterium]|nr:hypothetical protein [Parcubacteria group bacterium]
MTYVITVVDLGEDDGLDGRFVVKGLPTRHISMFWKKVMSIRACFPRPPKKGAREDGRLRIDFLIPYDYEEFLIANEKILRIIKRLMPDAKVHYRQLSCSGFHMADEDYDPYYDLDDEMLLVGAFTEEERDCLPRYQRAEILGIR